MTSLERLQASSFKLEDSISIEILKKYYQKWLDTGNDQYLEKIVLPIEKGAEFLPKIWVRNNAQEHISHGSPVFIPAIIQLTSNISKGREVAIFNQESELIAIGIAEMEAKEIMKKNKGLAIKTDTVLISQNG